MTEPASSPVPRLTSLAHGGGCGCKIAPAVLREIMAELPVATPFKDLLVGTETSDDAAVWRLNETQALVATTDFFMPVVDDPFDFGRIAAANALSDVYAMGARPIFALALVGMPVNVLPVETIRRILAGGQAIAAQAGVPIAGGHSIDSVEPIYGLVALGLVHPDKLLKNSGAQADDVLILTKPLGVGIYSAALKQGKLSEAQYEAFLASTTQLNVLGADLPDIEGVHGVTDVTGFGLLGHALEMARGAGLKAVIEARRLPFHPGVEALAEAGVRTGASGRNFASYGAEATTPEAYPQQRLDLLTDPQTSGGLLIACAPEVADQVLARARALGFASAAAVGRVVAGSGVEVEA